MAPAQSRLVPVLSAVTAASVAVAIAAGLHAWRGDTSGGWPDAARRELEALVAERYVDALTDADRDRLFDAAMRGYAEGLDPFSRYFPASERTAFEEDTSGRFGGIGVHAEAVPRGLFVTAVRRDGPADAAGISPGDVVELADGRPLAGRSRDEMIDLVRGPAGTSLRISLLPGGTGEPRALTVTRTIVDADSVAAVRMFAGGAGYLRIAQFADTTGAEVRAAIDRLAGEGAVSFVIDLRRNLGGVVLGAVEVASEFLPPDALVCATRSRDGVREYRARTADGRAPRGEPLVVLVDSSTASASEILAGALQDHARAVLVGERTYGKFVMQSLVPLRERGALLRLTTARYLTPNGRSDQRDPARGRLGGLLPDVRAPLLSDDDDRAVRDAFAADVAPAWRALPGDARPAPDRQLAAALALLAGGAAPAEPVARRGR